jgi:hypothetical protein
VNSLEHVSTRETGLTRFWLRNRPPKPPRDSFIKINSAILALGLFSLTFFLYQVYEVNQVNHWSKIDAVVAESKTVAYDVVTQSRFSGTRFHKHQELSFSFNYTIAGRRYVSNRFSRIGESPLDAVWDYPVGFHFTALCNPIDSTEAVVDPGHSNPIFLVISNVLVAVGAIGLRQCTSL